ncbi:MAG: lytic transglycosylase domain-containing protein, partial [Opitutaceae bacterium]|nr:lytic transglycosylase domain-containing protein [Opitutaceae bacterium]
MKPATATRPGSRLLRATAVGAAIACALAFAFAFAFALPAIDAAEPPAPTAAAPATAPAPTPATTGTDTAAAPTAAAVPTATAPTATAPSATAPIAAAPAVAAPTAAAPTAAAPDTEQPAMSIDEMNAIYDFGRRLFDDYAPGQIKEQYEFMSRDDWDTLITQFQAKLKSGSLEEIASLEPNARRTLAALRAKPEMSDYADWFAERLELIQNAKDAAKDAVTPPIRPPEPAAPAAPHQSPSLVLPPITLNPQPFYQVPPSHDAIPYYNLCFKRVSRRAKPKNADALAPLLKIIFASESLPVELVWLAEVESSFNPRAKSPAGARGLFQLMPATARALGLKTFPLDERNNAAKNTRAAARLLGRLHKRFGAWPLALAAYNAGEGRVAAALKKTPGARTYADIAAMLPAETRLYVPQVLATLVIRENVPLGKFLQDHG